MLLMLSAGAELVQFQRVIRKEVTLDPGVLPGWQLLLNTGHFLTRLMLLVLRTAGATEATEETEENTGQCQQEGNEENEEE